MAVFVGQVLGTQDSMPLDFWVAVVPGQFLELDDVVVVRTPLPNGQTVTLYGVVDIVKASAAGRLRVNPGARLRRRPPAD